MKRVFSYLKPYRGIAGLCITLVALATVCELLLPTVMSDILNNGVYNADINYITSCCLKMLIIALVSLICVVAGNYLNAKVVAGFCADLRRGIFAKANTLTFEEIAGITSSGLLTRSTHDVQTLAWVASMFCGSIVTIPVMFLGGVILAFLKDPVLSAIMLVVIPPVFLLVVKIGKKVEPLWELSDKYIDKQNDIIRERLHGIRVIRAFGREAHEQERAAEATKVMADNIIRGNVAMGLVAPVAEGLMSIAIVLIVWFGGRRMENGASLVNGGDVFAVIQYVTLMMNGVIMAAFALVMYPEAKVAVKRIGEVMDAKGMEPPDEKEIPRFQGGIAFDHVTFRYEDATEAAVEDITLEIKPGQTAALIGGTGSGKSTLVQLLLGFRRPTEGTVFFDDRNAREFSPAAIRQNISCVLQKTAIYAGTVRKNVTMGNPAAKDEEVWEALSDAQIADFVKEQAGGLDFELSQSGKNLSGGQKQRISIARALLKDAPIYLFDDAFSALDFKTEANVRRAIGEKLAGRTRVTVTQRVTAAMGSDVIFVLDKGRLVGQGNHAGLLENCSVYREIFLSQTGGERHDR